MAIYDNFPYTNIHEMNLRWVIEQVKQGNLTIEDFAEQLQQFRDDYDTLLALSAAFTIAGSNITTTKNFSAASLSGPLTGNVTGNLTGNVTGNVTGDLTGDVNGGSFQGSYVEATNGQITHNLTVGNDAEIFNNLTVDGIIFGSLTGNASTATHATTADSATTATTATSAGSATTLPIITSVTSNDMNDYVNDDPISMFTTTTVTQNCPSNPDMSGENAMVLNISPGAAYKLQFAWYWPVSDAIFVREKFGGYWQGWRKFTLTSA